MKKKIVIGSILTVIILMILPYVSAIEFNTGIEEKINNESNRFNEGLFRSILEFLIQIIADSPIGLITLYIISFIEILLFGPPEKI